MQLEVIVSSETGTYRSHQSYDDQLEVVGDLGKAGSRGCALAGVQIDKVLYKYVEERNASKGRE